MNKNKIFAFLGQYYYIVLPILISFGTVAFLHPWYDLAGDDVAIANIVYSAEWNPDSEFLLFPSVILGYILRFAAFAFPTLNVYGILLLLALTLAFFVFFYNTKKYDNKFVSISFISLMQFYMIYGITFTVVAFVCSAAAILLVVENVKELNKKSVKFFVLSFLLLLIGLGFRRTQLITAVCLILTPVCFFAFKQKRITASVLLVIVAITAGTNFAIKTIQREYREEIFAGTDYLEFSKYRSAGTDSGLLYYDRHAEYFDEHDISENDVNMYRSFYYNDKTVFPTDKVKDIAESFSFIDQYTLNPIRICGIIVKFPFVSAFLILALAYFLANKENRKEIFSYAFVVIGAVLYLSFRKRGVERVVKPITFIGMTILLQHFLRQGTKHFSGKQKMIFKISASVCLLALCVTLSYNSLPHVRQAEKKNAEPQEIMEYVKADKDHFYAPIGGVSLSRDLTFFRRSLVPDNIITGVYRGWTAYLPYWYRQVERYGLEEYKDCIYRSLLDNKIKIIYKEEYEIAMLTKTLEEHYGKKLIVQKEKEFENGFVCTLVEDIEETQE